MSWYDAYLDMVELERPEIANELREPPFPTPIQDPWARSANDRHIASANPATN